MVIKRLNKVINISLVLVMILTVLFFNKSNVYAADYNAQIKANASLNNVNVDTNNKVLETQNISGTVDFTYNQNAIFTSGLMSNLDLVSMLGRGSRQVNEGKDYIDITLTVPSSFNIKIEDIGSASVLKTKVLSSNNNVYVIRNYVTDGANGKRTVDETISAIGSDSSSATVGFKVTYSGEVTKDSLVNDYAINVSNGENEITYGFSGFISAQVALQGTSFNLLNAKVIDNSPINVTGDLEADMLVDNNTQHDSIFKTKRNNSHTFTGAINVKSIQNKLEELEKTMSNGNDLENILLSELSSTFITTFTLPKGLSYGVIPTKDNVILKGASDTFKVTDVKVNNQTATITMSLKEGIKNFKQLKEAILACDEILYTSIENVKVSNDLVKGETLKVIGSVKGNMYAKATVNNNTREFDMNWNAIQNEAGRDYTSSSNNNDITLTLKVPYLVEDKLDGDILIGEDTQHTSIYKAVKGNTYDFTGSLNVTKIKNQLLSLENELSNGNDLSLIGLNNLKSSFNATLELPKDLTVSQSLNTNNVKLNGASNTFTVTNVEVNDHKVTVTLTLKEGITNFKQLKEAILECEDTLDVIVPSIKVSDNAKGRYSVTGNINGSLNATAKVFNNEIDFEMNWNAKQLAEGRDFTKEDNDDEISFTLEVTDKVKQNTTDNTKQNINKKSTVKTGDSLSILSYVFLSIISLFIVIILFKKVKYN